MFYISAVYMDVNQCCEMFLEGVAFLEQYSFKESVDCFKSACESVAKNDRLYFKYKSYYGFSRFLNGDGSAIQICRDALKHYPFDGDICMNLARAEIVLSNRRNALQAIATGLSYSSNHEGLKALQKKLGVRRRKPLPLLSRENPISAALGRKMRKTYR